MLSPRERSGRRRWTLLVSALSASTLAVLFTSHRVFDEGAFSTEVVSTAEGLETLVRNVVQGLAFLVVAGIAIAALRERGWRLGVGRGTVIALAAFPLAILPSHVLGIESSTRNLTNLLGSVLLLMAAYGLPQVEMPWLVRLVKRTLLVFLYGSLAAAIVAPDWALQRGYEQGLFAALPVRLHGLAFHANALAPLAAIYLMLWRWRPASLPLEAMHAATAALVLVMCQSKTAWLGLAAAVAVTHAPRIFGGQRSGRAVAAVLGACIVGSAVLFVELIGAGPLTSSAQIAASNDDLLTFTGRLAIWGATLLVWQENTWFGYGPELWGEAMQEEFLPLLGWTFGHAHNFYFQVLGQAGLVGMAGALVFLAALARTSWRHRTAFGGALLATCVFVLLRTITEPTFTNRIAWSPDVVLVLLVVTAAARRAGAERRIAGRGCRRSAPRSPTDPQPGRSRPRGRRHAAGNWPQEMRMPSIGYLSGAPRVSTHAHAEATGPRAHVVGVIDAFRRIGWNVEPYIVGDLLPAGMRVTDASRKLHGSWSRRLAADFARLTLSAHHARQACLTLRGRVDWTYERLGVFQALGWPLRARGVPWVVETNAAFFREATTDRRSIVLEGVARRRELFAYRNADLVVAVTEQLKRTIVDASGVNPDKVIVVPNGVDAGMFKPLSPAPRHFEGPTILFAGALIGYQALDLLLEAVAAADAEGMRWHVAIVGDGLMRRAWSELTAQLGIADRVRFTGRLAWEDVATAIQGADVCYSGPIVTRLGVMYHSPLKLYEYMASGRPVLAAAHEDATRLVADRRTGFLFQPQSKESLMRALARAWQARHAWSEMGASARDLILREHTWDARVNQIATEVQTRVLASRVRQHASAA